MHRLSVVFVMVAGCGVNLPSVQSGELSCNKSDHCPGMMVCSSGMCVDYAALVSSGGEVVVIVVCDGPETDGNACKMDDGNEGVCRFDLGGCVETSCGDGFTDTVHGEYCDDGPGEGDGLCADDCSGWQVCGDGLTMGTEACDDGNTINETRCISADACRYCSGDCSQQIIMPGV